MGWYGGQEGAARTRWYDQSGASYNRFRSTVRTAKLTSFYNKVEVNRDRNVSNMLVRNPMSQKDLVKAVLDAAPTADDNGWAVAIAASEGLTDLSLLNDVANKITGLFLFGCGSLDQIKMNTFFSKLVNLESLTLVNCFEDALYRGQHGVFLKTIFSGEMLPKLKFLETDAASDDTIAEMSTSPDLVKITFSYPMNNITNEGIQRLVDAGGGKNLTHISGGTLKKHLTKTLTLKYVAATLPKLVNVPEYQAHQNLSHMAKGAKKKSAVERLQAKHAAEDSKPFAVVPPERMTYEQLVAALNRRGVYEGPGAKWAKKRTEEVRSKFTSGQVSWTHVQEQGFQNSAKLKYLQEELEKLRRRTASADQDVEKLSSGSLGRKCATKLYPFLGAYDIESALRETNVCIPRDASKRRDERAQLLHKSGYQGGGDFDNQLAHFTKVRDEWNEKVVEKNAEIQMLCQQMEKSYDTTAKDGKRKAEAISSIL